MEKAHNPITIKPNMMAALGIHVGKESKAVTSSYSFNVSLCKAMRQTNKRTPNQAINQQVHPSYCVIQAEILQ